MEGYGFPSWAVINVVDPRHLPFNASLLPSALNRSTADRKQYSTEFQAGYLSLPSRLRDLQIEYTAYSLVAPEKVRFRYKLEPHDRDCKMSATAGRLLHRSSARQNSFRVSAANDSGVWNEAGASFDFSVEPAYYQTLWFRLLMVACFADVGCIGLSTSRAAHRPSI
jgi:hypothetical protein